MKGYRRFVLACTLPVLVLLGPTMARADLPASVNQLLQRNRLQADSLSLVIQGVDQVQPLVSHGAHVARNPASVIKVLTTYVALSQLGRDYRWRTEAYVQGELARGSLNGPLVLKGYGDPFLSTEAFWGLLRGMRARGLRIIQGELLVDNSYFDPEPADPADFDGRWDRVYNAIPQAMAVNYQSTRLSLIPDPAAQQVRVVADPPQTTLQIRNDMRLISGRCEGKHYWPSIRILREAGGSVIWLKGDYAGSCRETEFYRLAAKPLAQVYGVFDALWQELGGSLEGGAGYGEVPGDARLLYSVESRPLRELIADMNKFSNNVMTRQLLLTLGAEVYGPPGTEAKGRDAVETWLRLRGIDTEGLILDNGSGLSRRSRISAAQLAAMLHYAYSQPDMPEFVSSMAVLGIDGTMARRFRNSPLTGRGHLKSGSLKDANNIAGYLQTRSGRRMVVVLFYNAARMNRGDVSRFQDQLLEWLYEQ